MNTTNSTWNLLRPLERVDLEGAPFESRLAAVPVSYALAPTVCEEGSYILSPSAGRAGFLPRECDMEGLVDTSLWATGEVGLSLEYAESEICHLSPSIPVELIVD
jgi:hypothetical protein